MDNKVLTNITKIEDTTLYKLLYGKEAAILEKKLPSRYVDNAKKEFSDLFSEVKKMKERFPDKSSSPGFMVLAHGKRCESKEKTFLEKIGKEENIQKMVTLLKMTENEKHGNKKEWNELLYLISAKYFLMDKTIVENTGGKHTQPQKQGKGTKWSKSVDSGLEDAATAKASEKKTEASQSLICTPGSKTRLFQRSKSHDDRAEGSEAMQTENDESRSLKIEKKMDFTISIKPKCVQTQTDAVIHIEEILQKVEKKADRKLFSKAWEQCKLLTVKNQNFKQKFPTEHSEIDMTEIPEDIPVYEGCQYAELHNILKTAKSFGLSCSEAWGEFVYLLRSEQNYIIIKNYGLVLKDSVYKQKSVTIPRKSYEDIQRELVDKVQVCEELQKEVLEKTQQIEELTNRLSKFASNQLTAGNPNIADLSDKHRPTKLGEYFSELYDSEWSEAFEAVKTERYPTEADEDQADSAFYADILSTLQLILRSAYEFCGERSETQLNRVTDTMMNAVKLFQEEKNTGSSSTTEKPRSNLRKIFETDHALRFRKAAASYTVENASLVFQQEGLKRVYEGDMSNSKLKAYVEKCIELTWYMRVQDPPMVLKFLQEGEPISKSEFSYHGRKGKITQVCVWPALLLHDGGSLVTKGHVLPKES